MKCVFIVTCFHCDLKCLFQPPIVPEVLYAGDISNYSQSAVSYFLGLCQLVPIYIHYYLPFASVKYGEKQIPRCSPLTGSNGCHTMLVWSWLHGFHKYRFLSLKGMKEKSFFLMVKFFQPSLSHDLVSIM
jgi:hypothetical protein